MNNKSILITGGTGSFGKAFLEYSIKKYKKIKKLVVFSRDELKQSELQKIYPIKKYPFIRFFIGDIRDKSRLSMALRDIDTIVHAAALKQIETAEYNPIETIKTNIIGSQNLVEVALESKVKNIIALSTDKAVSPTNLYGATKLCAEKLFLAANNIRGKNKIKFSIVRYGNVMGSRGSVLPIFLKKNIQVFPITHMDMTRFNITLDEGVKLVDFVIKNNSGGEIFIPKLKSFYIKDLARAIDSKKKIKVVGVRKGEKLHEELINHEESRNCVETKNLFILYPNPEEYERGTPKLISNGRKVKKPFSYNSFDNNEFFTLNELKKVIANS